MRTFCLISQGLSILPGIHRVRSSAKWCRVHPVSTRYATVYMLLHFPLSEKHELCNDYKAVDGHRTNKNVAHRGPVPTFGQGLDLVPGHPHRARILAWVCLRKECVHISVQRVQYLGTKCEGCLTFPRSTKERGHVCTHAICSIDVEFRF